MQFNVEKLHVSCSAYHINTECISIILMEWSDRITQKERVMLKPFFDC
jgi:hypothetical protein